MSKKLTPAQWKLLKKIAADKRALVNFDEATPMWWTEGGPGCNPRTADALAKSPYLEFFKHEGGQPGILYFRITPAGLAALAQEGGE